jgi:hypothetical protein
MTDTRQPELSLERFEKLVESYGGDLDRYPVREREAAKALVLRSNDARRMLDAARALDAMLALARDGAPSVELESALASIPTRHEQVRPVATLLPFRSRNVGYLAAAAALLLGVWSGGLAATESAPSGPVTSFEGSEVAAFAFADELASDLGGDEWEEEWP